MVEKIIINPNKVRGYGNIMSQKTGADFTVNDCILIVDTDTVNGELVTVYELQPSATVLSVVLTVNDNSVLIDETVTLSATVSDEMTNPVSGASVSFNLNGASIGTSTTNSSGVATYQYTCNTAGTLSFSASCMGNNSNNVNVTVTGHDYSLTFSSTSYTTNSSGDATVSAVLTDNGTEVSGATVTFTGGTSTVTATTNSSGVATATVHFTSDGTLTATSNGVSDTCSIILFTYLFYDACNSSEGLTNYGASQVARGSTATITMSYDSNENAYKVYGSGNYHAFVPITPLNGEDNYTISMDCKGQAIRYNMVGFFLDNSANTTSYGLCFGLDIGKADNGTNQSLYSRLYRPNSDGSGYITYLDSNVLTADKYYNLRFTVNGNTLTGALYDGTTKLAEKTVTYTINNKSMGIFLYCEKGTTQSACYVKNIKAEAL